MGIKGIKIGFLACALFAYGLHAQEVSGQNSQVSSIGLGVGNTRNISEHKGEHRGFAGKGDSLMELDMNLAVTKWLAIRFAAGASMPYELQGTILNIDLGNTVVSAEFGLLAGWFAHKKIRGYGGFTIGPAVSVREYTDISLVLKTLAGIEYSLTDNFAIYSELGAQNDFYTLDISNDEPSFTKSYSSREWDMFVKMGIRFNI